MILKWLSLIYLTFVHCDPLSDNNIARDVVPIDFSLALIKSITSHNLSDVFVRLSNETHREICITPINSQFVATCYLDKETMSLLYENTNHVVTVFNVQTNVTLGSFSVTLQSNRIDRSIAEAESKVEGSVMDSITPPDSIRLLPRWSFRRVRAYIAVAGLYMTVAEAIARGLPWHTSGEKDLSSHLSVSTRLDSPPLSVLPLPPGSPSQPNTTASLNDDDGDGDDDDDNDDNENHYNDGGHQGIKDDFAVSEPISSHKLPGLNYSPILSSLKTSQLSPNVNNGIDKREVFDGSADKKEVFDSRTIINSSLDSSAGTDIALESDGSCIDGRLRVADGAQRWRPGVVQRWRSGPRTSKMLSISVFNSTLRDVYDALKRVSVAPMLNRINSVYRSSSSSSSSSFASVSSVVKAAGWCLVGGTLLGTVWSARGRSGSQMFSAVPQACFNCTSVS